MQTFISTLNGKTLFLDVAYNEHFDNLKLKISEKKVYARSSNDCDSQANNLRVSAQSVTTRAAQAAIGQM